MKKCVFALFFIMISFCFVACKTTEEMLPKEISLEIEVGNELGEYSGYIQNKVLKEVGAVLLAFDGEVSSSEVSDLVRAILVENGLSKEIPIYTIVEDGELCVKIGRGSLNKLSTRVVI